LLNLAGCFNPIQMGHGNIEQDYRWPQSGDKLKRFPAITGFADYCQIGFIVQQGFETLTHDHMIFHQ
jgi:hypothetical protein